MPCSFPWFCGAYGLAPPNKKIPRLHLFITVKRGKKKLDVRHDLQEKYKCDPKKYFELLQEPKNAPKIRYLGNGSIEGSSQATAVSSVPKVLPSPGGGVLACISGNPNRSRGPDEDDRDDSPEVQGTGTLTLFCFCKGHHYALTCFHVGCANDEMRYNALNKVEDVQKIRNSLPTYVLEAKRKKYLFTGDLEENNNERISYGNDGSNYTPLGNFHSYRFDSECDILCLKISNDAKINCKIADVGSPDWESIWDELIEKFSKTTVEVGKLQLSPLSGNGHVVSCCISYGKEKVLFKNAVVVKGCATSTGPFLENGDSGSLVFFHANNKKPFAYGVCEVDELHLPQHDFTRHTTGSIDDGSDTSSSWSEEEYSNESMSESEDKLEAVEEGAEYKDMQALERKNQIKCKKDNECQNYGKCHDKDFNDPDDSEIMFREDTGPYFICLRLDTALEKLGLDEAACVDNCGRSSQFVSHE